MLSLEGAFACSSLAFLILELLCLSFCSSHFFLVFVSSEVWFLSVLPVLLQGNPLGQFWTFCLYLIWWPLLSYVIQRQFYVSVLCPSYMLSSFWLKGAPDWIGQSGLKPEVLLTEDIYQTLPPNIQISLIRTCYKISVVACWRYYHLEGTENYDCMRIY